LVVLVWPAARPEERRAALDDRFLEERAALAVAQAAASEERSLADAQAAAAARPIPVRAAFKAAISVMLHDDWIPLSPLQRRPRPRVPQLFADRALHGSL